MADKLDLLTLTVFSLFLAVVALPEQGKWTETVKITKGKNRDLLAFTKSMFNHTEVTASINCHGHAITVDWLLRWSPCAEEYIGVETAQERLGVYFDQPTLDQVKMGYSHVHYITDSEYLDCASHDVPPLKGSTAWISKEAQSVDDKGETQAASQSSPAKDDNKTRRRRDADGSADTHGSAGASNALGGANNAGGASNVASANTAANGSVPQSNLKKKRKGSLLATAERDGIYLLIIRINSNSDDDFDVDVTVEMALPDGGYISAIEWPFLPFYGTMCLVYVIYGLTWLILSMCNWKDLLRIQFWIGAVIFLGMLEKAVFFAEYESINKTGESVKGAVVFAELVSCLKRTLARMLVIIVSVGFGIVKPRLGPAFHKVLGTGILYFILASVEGCMRVLRPKGDNSNQTMFATIPLAVLDAAICWWFTSLVQTTRTLRLRRNLVKLSLYRHFTNTLIFAVLASVAFMIWSIKQHKLAICLTDWKEMWVDEAFWHILFSVILLVIMILWRPTINNQRYAFSPLLDAADEEAEEPMINDAYDGMKMRGKNDSELTKKPKDGKNKAEDDLKWIDENIPASVADTALPSLLDSDEEIMTTRMEISKMQ